MNRKQLRKKLKSLFRIEKPQANLKAYGVFFLDINACHEAPYLYDSHRTALQRRRALVEQLLDLLVD